jgi:hypothetical protein
MTTKGGPVFNGYQVVVRRGDEKYLAATSMRRDVKRSLYQSALLDDRDGVAGSEGSGELRL